MLRGVVSAAFVAALACSVAFAAGPAKMTFTPFGERDLVPIDMTPDGSKIVGAAYFGSPYFTWTRGEGLVFIGGGCGAGQPAISGDGNTIFGTACDENGVGEAARWLGGTDWQLLGSVAGAVNCDFSLSSGWDVNYDGSVGVGLAWLPQICRAHAGSWDLVNGGPATDLGSTVPDRATRANAISGDGRIIAGWQDDELGQRAGARWINGVEEPLLTDAGENVGEVFNINYDGTVMVGISYPYGASEGWVWTLGGGFTPISSGGVVYRTVLPVAVSADGALVAGAVRENNQGDQKAFFFKRGRFTYLTPYLAKKGLAAGWNIKTISTMSADGTKLAGWGINPSGFIEGFVIENFR
jgi:uncharacterized membrane protein